MYSRQVETLSEMLSLSAVVSIVRCHKNAPPPGTEPMGWIETDALRYSWGDMGSAFLFALRAFPPTLAPKNASFSLPLQSLTKSTWRSTRQFPALNIGKMCTKTFPVISSALLKYSSISRQAECGGPHRTRPGHSVTDRRFHSWGADCAGFQFSGSASGNGFARRAQCCATGIDRSTCSGSECGGKSWGIRGARRAWRNDRVSDVALKRRLSTCVMLTVTK